MEMARAVARHDELLRAAAAKHNGSVFKTVGDAFCVAFARPQDAVAAAIDAQLALRAEDFSSVGGMRVRMAIHTGAAEERDGDYYGPPVNRVARLLAVGHGGQVLISQASTDLLYGSMPEHAGVRDLGQHRLRDLVRPEQVHQLVAPGLEEIFPSLRSLEALPNNLPRHATVFVGREHELHELKALLTRSQLVTLVGTGGVGKTRVAVQVAADLLDAFGDGVWFVDLAQVGTQDALLGAVAAVFDLQLQPDRNPLDDICLYLKNKRLLLILDNCEHIVTETARVVAALVKNCPNVVVLATSREVLNVGGEHVYRVPSLTLPPADAMLSADAALEHEAVALFVARAAALNTRFVLSDDNAPVVADICRRLDGIALAIELAAARVSILNLKQLAQRLDERFRLLTGGDRTALPRQQTMRAAIDWSYDLLTEPERAVFRRLTVFQGGWTLEAASAVCSDDAIDEFQILDIVSSLVNKSLITVDADAETQRYRLLESLRQYGLERLQQHGELDATARHHARFFAEYARQVAERWKALPALAWLALVEAELDNMRAAMRWSLDQGADRALGSRIVESLWPYWMGHAKLEGRHRLEAARASVTPESDPHLSIGIDLALTRLQIGSAEDEAYEATLARAVAAARRLGDDKILARALFYEAEGLASGRGSLDEATPILIEALAAARRAHDSYRETASLQELAKVYTATKRFELAREHFASATRYYTKRGADRNWIIMLLDQAALEKATGDLPRAIGRTEEALEMARSLRETDMQALLLSAKAAYFTMMERFDEARSAMQSSLRILSEELLDIREVALLPCVALAVHDEDFERAAHLLGYKKADSNGWVRETRRVPTDGDRLEKLLGERIGETRLRTLMAEGEKWSQEQAFEAAVAICEGSRAA